MAKKKKKTYQERLMDQAKGTMKLGTLTTVGGYAFGRVGANHPQLQPVTKSVTGALALTNVGNMANIGMNIMPTEDEQLVPKQKKTKTKKKKSGSNVVDNILGW